MKQLILFTLAITALTACKKDYTCSCEITSVYTNNTGSVQTNEKSTQKFSQVNKKYARQQCTSGTYTKVTGSGVNEVREEYIRGCVLNQD